jgi:hypothetical protein
LHPAVIAGNPHPLIVVFKYMSLLEEVFFAHILVEFGDVKLAHEGVLALEMLI